MKALRTNTPAALDNPSRWHQYLRPWFDVVRYQHAIDQRVGVNADGHSIIKLVWGQDAVQRAFAEQTPRYWTRRQKAAGGHTYWTVPRWIFEKRLEPEQYVDSWEATRWSITDPITGLPVDKGEPPAEYHTFAYLCAVHDDFHIDGWPQCCHIAYYTNRARCWGSYRQPNDDDLQLVSQAVRQMEADKYIDPYRPLSTAELQEAELAANMQVERANAEFEEYEASMFRDFAKLHGHRLFEGPNSFHDQHFERAASGLLVPKGE